MGGDKKKGKRKKDPNSPDFQLAQPGQKRTTMEMNGQNGGQQKQQQTQASASYMYQTFTPQQPLQPNIHYGQPYYGSPPAPAISQMPQISQMPPIPISPSVSQPQNAQNTLTQDVITKLFERLDMMDKKLGQLESIQSSLHKVTVQVNDMNTTVSSMELQLRELEQSREYDSKTLQEMQERQREIDSLLQKMQKAEVEQKERLIDLQCRQMRDNLIFYNIRDDRGEQNEACAQKLIDFLEYEMKVENARSIRFDRIHRLGRYDPAKNRPVIAKFCFFQEREMVRSCAKNLDGSPYAVSQQFPKEVLEKRRSLIPTLKSLRDQGKRAYISVDKLFVDGRIYKGPLIESNESTNRQGTSGRGWGQGRGRGFGRIAGQGQGRGRGREQDQGQTPNTGVATGLDQNPFGLLETEDSQENQTEGQGQMEAESSQVDN